jgi:hypothetical protein
MRFLCVKWWYRYTKLWGVIPLICEVSANVFSRTEESFTLETVGEDFAWPYRKSGGIRIAWVSLQPFHSPVLQLSIWLMLHHRFHRVTNWRRRGSEFSVKNIEWWVRYSSSRLGPPQSYHLRHFEVLHVASSSISPIVFLITVFLLI